MSLIWKFLCRYVSGSLYFFVSANYDKYYNNGSGELTYLMQVDHAVYVLYPFRVALIRKTMDSFPLRMVLKYNVSCI